MENLELRVMEMEGRNEMKKRVGEFEIIYKPTKGTFGKVNSSYDAYCILQSFWSERIEHIEEFNIITLNRANMVTGFHNICKGGIAGTYVDIKVILQAALLSNSTSIIVAHNHPSGNMIASNEDLKMTNKIKAACLAVDLVLLDHIIMSPQPNVYLSLADEGKI